MRISRGRVRINEEVISASSDVRRSEHQEGGTTKIRPHRDGRLFGRLSSGKQEALGCLFGNKTVIEKGKRKQMVRTGWESILEYWSCTIVLEREAIERQCPLLIRSVRANRQIRLIWQLH